MLKLKLQYFWPPDAKKWLTGKDLDAGKDWRQEEKGTTEDKMVGWHHWLNGHESEQAPGVGDRQGRLACCSPWDPQELDMTERLNWTDKWSSWGLVRSLGQGKRKSGTERSYDVEFLSPKYATPWLWDYGWALLDPADLCFSTGNIRIVTNLCLTDWWWLNGGGVHLTLLESC